eukprot:1071885-Rhodomonas_salina.2
MPRMLVMRELCAFWSEEVSVGPGLPRPCSRCCRGCGGQSASAPRSSNRTPPFPPSLSSAPFACSMQMRCSGSRPTQCQEHLKSKRDTDTETKRTTHTR